MIMPEGKICVVGFAGEVVNATGHAVPFDEVYTHHCDLYNNDRPNNAWDVTRAFPFCSHCTVSLTTPRRQPGISSCVGTTPCSLNVC